MAAELGQCLLSWVSFHPSRSNPRSIPKDLDQRASKCKDKKPCSFNNLWTLFLIFFYMNNAHCLVEKLDNAEKQNKEITTHLTEELCWCFCPSTYGCVCVCRYTFTPRSGCHTWFEKSSWKVKVKGKLKRGLAEGWQHLGSHFFDRPEGMRRERLPETGDSCCSWARAAWQGMEPLSAPAINLLWAGSSQKNTSPCSSCLWSPACASWVDHTFPRRQDPWKSGSSREGGGRGGLDLPTEMAPVHFPCASGKAMNVFKCPDFQI